MTDARSTIAGSYPGPNNCKITCILDEGTGTVSSTVYDQTGLSAKGLTWGSELEEGDYVALSNDTANTFVATGGVPVVEMAQNGETLVIGKIISTPKLNKFPPTTASADTLAERLAAGYYRTAVVEILGGVTKIEKATVMCDGSNACVPGVGSTLKFNITSGYATTGAGLQFDSASSGGVGVIPFHYCPAGTDGDLYSCLVGITALMIAVTGA